MSDEAAGSDTVSAARNVAATVLEMVQTRLDLAATELTLERVRLARQFMDATLALWALAVGVMLLAVALALASAPEQRVPVLSALGGLFVGIGAIAVLRWRSRRHKRSALLEQTLRTLRADAAALRPGAPRDEAP